MFQVLNILKLKLQNRFTTETSVEFYILGDKNQTKRDLADPFLVIVQKPNVRKPISFKFPYNFILSGD